MSPDQLPADCTIHPHKVYSVRQVAELLSVCEDTIYRWAAAGKIRTVRVSGNRGRHRIMGVELLKVMGVPAVPEIETIPERKARAKRALDRIKAARYPAPSVRT